MEAIILRLSPYKEKDYIVNALTTEGFVSFKAQGGQSINSKFSGKLFAYALVELELTPTKAGFNLSYIHNLMNMATISTVFDKMIMLNIIGECVSKTLKDENSVKDVFPFLKKALLGIEKTTAYYSLLFLFLTRYLKLLGFGLEINKCVRCGSRTNIVGLSLKEGGFLCRACQNNEMISVNEEEVKLLRYGFMFNDDDLFKHEFTADYIRPWSKIMLTHFEETFNVDLVSKPLLF